MPRYNARQFSQPPAPPTLDRALRLLLEHTGRRVREGIRSAATLEMQERHRVYLLRDLGDVPLTELTGARLYDLAEHWNHAGGVHGQGLAWKTVAKLLSTLRRALRLARVRDELDRMPEFPEVALPPAQPRMRVLHTFEQYRRLMGALRPHRADWIGVALWTCQHAADVERMTWSDVDLDGPTCSMRIRNTKNRKPTPIRVKCPRPMVELLLARRVRLEAMGRPPQPTDPLVTRWPGRSRVLPLVCARLGLPLMTANDLRHTGTSWMVRRTGLTVGAQKWGGWSSFAMMERYYAHALPAQLDECADELASIALEVQPVNDNGAAAAANTNATNDGTEGRRPDEK